MHWGLGRMSECDEESTSEYDAEYVCILDTRSCSHLGSHCYQHKHCNSMKCIGVIYPIAEITICS